MNFNKYALLSKKEINQLVAGRLNQPKVYDYCDNPNHAWPIIDAHLSDLMQWNDNGMTNLELALSICDDENKLKAALVVYLTVTDCDIQT